MHTISFSEKVNRNPFGPYFWSGHPLNIFLQPLDPKMHLTTNSLPITTPSQYHEEKVNSCE